MTESYFSIAHDGEAIYEEKKSVFYGFAAPVQEEQEAVDYIGKIKRRFPDAKHHVYAYVLRRDNKSRYTDDGEPAGTAGMPVLEVIRKQGLTDCVVVVVRYFGGTLLGTGGLVRAYTTAAADAVKQAETIRRIPVTELRLACSYSEYQKLVSLLAHVKLKTSEFGDSVTLIVELPSADADGFVQEVMNRTAGRASCEKTKESLGVFP
jgi:uncharacterized YigZ family protein